MKITEYNVALQQLVERDLTQEEIDFFNSPMSKSSIVKWNLTDSKEDQILDIVSQYVAKGYSQQEAEFLANNLVG
jgi:hypothetical protein